MAKAIFREDGELTGYGGMEVVRLTAILKPLFQDGAPHKVSALLHTVVEEMRCEAVLDARDKQACETCGWHNPKGHDRMRCGVEPGDCLDFDHWKPQGGE